MLCLTWWDFLGIISLFCLMVSFFLANSLFIQGGFMAGMSMSILLIIITYFKDGAINWILTKDVLTVFVLLGGLLEIADRILRFKNGKEV